MIVNQLFLSLFFIYFVLISSNSSTLMSCSLQHYINDNYWINHLLIFMSIYIFTFILNWYSIDSLVVEKFTLEKYILEPHYLLKSLYYTILIYLVFIIR